jgi:hypothetical protein
VLVSFCLIGKRRTSCVTLQEHLLALHDGRQVSDTISEVRAVLWRGLEYNNRRCFRDERPLEFGSAQQRDMSQHF